MAEITYSKAGGYLLPDIAIRGSGPLGMYGMMRKSYLKNHRPSLYSKLALSEGLYPHCLEVEGAANESLALTMGQLQAQSPPPDKASDPLGWAAHMNGLKAQAEEAIFSELIYG